MFLLCPLAHLTKIKVEKYFLHLTTVFGTANCLCFGHNLTCARFHALNYGCVVSSDLMIVEIA